MGEADDVVDLALDEDGAVGEAKERVCEPKLHEHSRIT